MTFGQALLAMRLGERVRRRAWEAGLFIRIEPDPRPAIVVHAASYDGGSQPSAWLPTQASLLAEDWERAASLRPRGRRVLP
jgi:hypothetical protein